MAGNGNWPMQLKKVDGSIILLNIPEGISTWGQVYAILGRQERINPKTKTIMFYGKPVQDNTPFVLKRVLNAATIHLLDRPRIRWTRNINDMVNRGEMTAEQANQMMGHVRGHNNRESKRHRIARIEREIAENKARISELMREKERLEAEVRASQRNTAGVAAAGAGAGAGAGAAGGDDKKE